MDSEKAVKLHVKIAMMEVADLIGKKKPKEKETPEIKPVEDIVACVVDYGTFLCLADKLSETYAKVYYYTPTSEEFYSVDDLVKGSGLPNVERVQDIFDPVFLEKIDLFIFPDIGYGGLQKYLRSIGKAVWGSMGADELEVVRTEFLSTLKRLGLPTIHTETIKGLGELRRHLKKAENKWIKVDKYRGNMETWHHIDIEHSAQELDRLAIEFGGLQEEITFQVQDFIKTDIELGYDGWCVDGRFPSETFQGYERKDELYLGARFSNEDLPEQIKAINEALAPLLKEYGYRNFFATEIRVKDDVPYFIDPTLRMPGITGEQLLETCGNIAEVIWRGANGELIEPDFIYDFAATATIHCKDDKEGWKMMRIPDDVKQWVKLLHYCKVGNLYHFPKRFNDELGLMVGVGDSIEGAVQMVVDNLEKLKDEPVFCELDGYSSLVDDMLKAEEHGITTILGPNGDAPDLDGILP